jgi:hypothetical protein
MRWSDGRHACACSFPNPEFQDPILYKICDSRLRNVAHRCAVLQLCKQYRQLVRMLCTKLRQDFSSRPLLEKLHALIAQEIVVN